MNSPSILPERHRIEQGMLNHLPPDYRRRAYTNIAILVVLFLLVTNAWRLGQKNGAVAILVLFASVFAFGCVWPVVTLVRAKPRPGRAAFILAGVYIVSFLYVALALALSLPGSALALLIGVITMWAVVICYRGIIFSSLFSREGGLSDRWKVLRAAQRERQSAQRSARAEIEARYSRGDDAP
jgi:hypothetical protein